MHGSSSAWSKPTRVQPKSAGWSSTMPTDEQANKPGRILNYYVLDHNGQTIQWNIVLKFRPILTRIAGEDAF